MLILTGSEKAEEDYLIVLDKLWLYEVKPELDRFSPKTMPSTDLHTGTVVKSNRDEGSVAAEINLLSAQVGALQETMQDLYESVFASDLAGRHDKNRG